MPFKHLILQSITIAIKSICVLIMHGALSRHRICLCDNPPSSSGSSECCCLQQWQTRHRYAARQRQVCRLKQGRLANMRHHRRDLPLKAWFVLWVFRSIQRPVEHITFSIYRGIKHKNFTFSQDKNCEHNILIISVAYNIHGFSIWIIWEWLCSSVYKMCVWTTEQ